MSSGFSSIPERAGSLFRAKAPELLTPRRARNQYSVPRVFYLEIATHYFVNATELPFASLILAIEGPPGEGKSFQIRESLSRLGVEHIVLGGASLSGAHEGDALEPIARAYTELSKRAEVTGRSGCIIIDDMDLSVAGRGDRTEYTVNSQLLSSFLMSLADNPRVCNGEAVRRTPIFFTGNNLARLYGPLVRRGRCRVFSWHPNAEVKKEILRGMLAEIGCIRAEEIASEAIYREPGASISTFRAAVENISYSIVGTRISRGENFGHVTREEVMHEITKVTPELFVNSLSELGSKRFGNHDKYR